MKFVKGQVWENGHGQRKVLSVAHDNDQVALFSRNNNLEESSGWRSIRDLQERGFSLLSEPREERNIEEKYYELLMAVVNKYDGETRHETALRYIKQAESSVSEPNQASGYTIKQAEEVLERVRRRRGNF